MGRLFWKIFLTLFLAQISTVAVVAMLLWHTMPGRDGPPPQGVAHGQLPPMPPHDGHPPPPPHDLPLIPVSVGFLASLVFAFLLARYLSKPIMGLRSAFREVAQGNFEVDLTGQMGHRRDELADLGRDFDNTARQLKQLMANQRRLLHDVSHEVRSPLARMQLAIDLARQQPDRTLDSVQRIERESARINLLMEELLTLSRLETRTQGGMDDEIDLIELVSEIVDDASYEASAKNCRVELSAPDHAQLRGNGGLLSRAIENIVRNAVRHTFEKTTVRIEIRKQEKETGIRIMDDGPGIPEAALEAMFEPFVRFEEDRGNDGYGLGLAISREVVEAHGGHIRAYNRDTGGLCIEVKLQSYPPAVP